jgi:hypothetical protein
VARRHCLKKGTRCAGLVFSDYRPSTIHPAHQRATFTLSMSSPKLPSELTDGIIDHLCDDMHALAKCSSVCKSWLTRSRHHYFRHIFLTNRDRGRINDFITLCGSSFSTITPYIHSVHLLEGRSSSRRWIDNTKAQLSMFGAVESLTLERATFLHIDAPAETLFSKFPRLKKLSLLSASFRSLSHLVHIVEACSHLEYIALDGLKYRDEVDLPIERQPPSRLRKLKLGSCFKVEVIDWLLASQVAPPLTAFCATSLKVQEISSVGTLLGALAPSLEYLELGSDSYRSVGSAYYMGMYSK